MIRQAGRKRIALEGGKAQLPLDIAVAEQARMTEDPLQQTLQVPGTADGDGDLEGGQQRLIDRRGRAINADQRPRTIDASPAVTFLY